MEFSYSKVKLFAISSIGGISLGLIVPGFLALVVMLGHNIHHDDLEMDYFFALIWAVVLGASILAWPVSSGDKRCLLWVWLAKVGVALGFMLTWEARDPDLDGYKYFQVSRSPMPWEEFSWESGMLISRIARAQTMFLPDSYHAVKLSFAMVGLIAVYFFYRAAVTFLRREDRRVFFALALFPSVLFWSSSLNKDAVALLGIALYVYGVVKWHYYKRKRYIFVLALGVIIASFIRVWLGPILLAPIAFVALLRMRGIMRRAALIILMIAGTQYFLNIVVGGIGSVQDLISYLNAVSQYWSHGGSAQQLPWELTSIQGVVAFIPLGAFTALFRPFPGEVLNPFGLLAGLENLVLVVFLLLAIRRTRWRELQEPLIMWAVFVIVTWSAVYGFVSYQNLGTAVRFKLQILPLLLCVLMYLARRRRRYVLSQAPIHVADVRV